MSLFSVIRIVVVIPIVIIIIVVVIVIVVFRTVLNFVGFPLNYVPLYYHGY